MIRVLQCVNDMHRAGLETMLMNYYRNIDRTKIQFDFLTHRPDKSDYDDEILSLGGKVYYAPRLYPQNYPAYFKYMKKFFAEHPEYQIVHSHIDSMSYLPLLAAKKAGVPIRIAHSHNTSIDKDFKYILKQYFRKKVTKAANYYCACGQEAGEFLFPGKEFTFIPNAIEVDKFLYNEEVRDRKRKDLGLTSEFVVGHVGRLSYQKNHELLIRIFNELHKKDANTILLLIGVGEKENEIRKQDYVLLADRYRKAVDFNSSWPMVCIGDVCEVERGASPRPINDYITDDPNGVNWIKIGDGRPNSLFIYSTKEKITLEGARKSRFVKKGDLILSNSMSFGRPYILGIDGCVHDGWLIIRNSKGLFDPIYLCYMLGSEAIMQEYQRLATGGVVNNLNSDLVRSCKIPLPPLETQKSIVAEIEQHQLAIKGYQDKIIEEDMKIKERIAEVWGM